MTDIEIFSAYLPYLARCKYASATYYLSKVSNFSDGFITVNKDGRESYLKTPKHVKIILKPLDTIDWHKVEKDMGEFLTADMIEFIWNAERSSFNILDAPYLLVQWLIKNHYDVFGAIEKGIAISE